MSTFNERMTFRLSWQKFLFILACYLCQIVPLCGEISIADTETTAERKPTVFVVLLVRNKAHALPYFFGYMENLDYAKERISWWIRSDHNSDNTSAVLKEWVQGIGQQYHSIDIEIDETDTAYSRERGPCDWTTERMGHVMRTKQAGLEAAKKQWADYAFMIDSDVLIENPKTLSMLIDQQKTIVAPMLNSRVKSAYSNFWGGMTETGYYRRVEQYFPVLHRESKGLFSLPMVHTALLVNLRHEGSEKLAYDPAPPGYDDPFEDMIRFAFSARAAGIKMHLLNTESFGHVMIPSDKEMTLEYEREGFCHMKTEAIVYGDPLIRSPHIYVEDIPADKLGFDEIYVINLKRRPERRDRVLRTLKELGIDAQLTEAVDGWQINSTYLKEQGVSTLPFVKQGVPHATGFFGCFLSHYNIWLDMIEKGHERVIVFEDDVRFDAYFRTRLFKMLLEIEKARPDWELIFLGRVAMSKEEDNYVKGTETAVYPLYSYGTWGYVLTKRGAQKFLDQKPLTKVLNVDEFFCLMFDSHPVEEFKNYYHPRDLIALSAEPVLVHATHDFGEAGEISDTFNSPGL